MSLHGCDTVQSSRVKRISLNKIIDFVRRSYLVLALIFKCHGRGPLLACRVILAGSRRHISPVPRSPFQSAVLLYKVDVLKNATVPFLTVAFEQGPNLNETTRPLLLGQARSLSASLEGASRLIRSSLQEPFVQMSAPLDYSLVSQYEPYRYPPPTLLAL